MVVGFQLKDVEGGIKDFARDGVKPTEWKVLGGPIVGFTDYDNKLKTYIFGLIVGDTCIPKFVSQTSSRIPVLMEE